MSSSRDKKSSSSSSSSSSKSRDKSKGSSSSSSKNSKSSSSTAVAAPTHSSIRDIVRSRLIGLFDEFSESNEGWKVLVVDDVSLKFISVACRVRDILQKNITIVERLSISRQPFPQMEAIYFITPSKESIELAIKDFADAKRPMYSFAHILTTSALSENLLSKIASSPMKPRIKTLREVYIDFLAIERNCFTFNYPNDIQLAYGDLDRKSFCSLLADRLVSFCATVGHLPYIRYNKSDLSSGVASALFDKLEKARKTLGLTRKKSVILILDRGVDCLAPILHEFTYQAMAYDLINIDPMGMYEELDSKGKKTGKQHSLDEYDELWVEHRHRHFAELGSMVKQQFDDFLAQHKDITDKDKRAAKKDASDISGMIRKLPQYQGKLSQLALHMNLIVNLLNRFNSQKLDTVALEEQNMAVGEDPDHQKLKDVLGNISPILKSPEVTDEDKLRLVMVYLITQGDSKKNKVLKFADFDVSEEQAIDNLSLLGVQLSKSFTARAISKIFGSSKNKKGEVGYHLSRYVPKVKEIAEECINGSLSTSEYPYVKDPSSGKFEFIKGSSSSSSSGKSSKSKSGKDEDDNEAISGLDNSGPSWNKKKSKKGSSSSSGGSSSSKKHEDKAEVDEGRSDKRLFIFMIGGMTMSEMRSAYELDAQYKIDVHIGSTSVLTPHEFLKKLKTLKKGSSSSGKGASKIIDSDSDSDSY
jgi:syntaxin-binding protein 1